MRIPEPLWTSGTAFVVALVLTPIIRDIFHAYNVVDRPGLRKVHAHPIPRLGGLAIAVAYLIALAWASGGASAQALTDSDALLWKLLPGTATILFTGMLDDFFNLAARYKLVGQIAAACIAYASGLRIDSFGATSLPVAVSFPVTIFWLLLAMNAFNLIDGLDGLCAGVGFIGTGALYAVARVEGNAPLETVTLPLTGALLGFLCYNFSRATMFLGDSGALLIGFLLGSSGILFFEHGTKLGAAVPLMAIGVPLADLTLSVVRRFLANRPIFAADRGHIHHRLLDRGYSARRVVLILYAWAVAGAVFAFLTGYPAWQRWQPFTVLAGLLIAWMGVQQLRYSELTMVAKHFFGAESHGAAEDSKSMRKLAAALDQAGSETEWWGLLVAAGEEAGWADLLWVRDHSVRREKVFASHAAPVWSFNLALSDSESLQIHGFLLPVRPSLEILAFAQVVQRAYAGRRQVWDRPAIS